MTYSRCLLVLLVNIMCLFSAFGQKMLQLEKIGEVQTTKFHLGETIFIRTVDHPDYWLEAILEDVMVDAQAIVLIDRIIAVKDIVAIKKRKKSGAHHAGKAIQYSSIAPVGYEMIYGLVNPPIEWKSLAIFSGGSFALGSLLRLVPPKQYKMGKKYRLRIIDLTFYSRD